MARFSPRLAQNFRTSWHSGAQLRGEHLSRAPVLSFVSISSKTVVECSDERPSSSQQAKAIPSAPCNGLLPASSLRRYQVFWSRINALDGDEARQCTHAFVDSAESRVMGKLTSMCVVPRIKFYDFDGLQLTCLDFRGWCIPMMSDQRSAPRRLNSRKGIA